jgi:hypothetical protein
VRDVLEVDGVHGLRGPLRRGVDLPAWWAYGGEGGGGA